MKKIILTSAVEGFANLEASKIHKARDFLPKWYKDLPKDIEDGNGYNGFVSKLIPNLKTAKMCPSFGDLFKESYVVTAPCDIHIGQTERGTWVSKMSNPDFILRRHPDDMYTNHVKESGVRGMYTLSTGWNIITPKGYSARFDPLFYHHNKDWVVPPGIVKQDKFHSLNIIILYTSEKNEIYIKQGEPLCYLTPYKRQNYRIAYESYERHRDRIKTSKLSIVNKFKFGYSKESRSMK